MNISSNEIWYVKYDSSITYHSKAMATVEVLCRQTNGVTERWTNRQVKNYMPQIYRCGGIKKKNGKQFKPGLIKLFNQMLQVFQSDSSQY